MRFFSASPYRRLPGQRRNVNGFCDRLWLGADHLLSVHNRHYSESYKRFYYRDIEAVSVRRTARRMWWNIFWSVLFTGSCALVLTIEAATVQIVWGSLAALWLLCILYNSLAGPTCISHLRTAVQTVHLPSLHRLHLFRKSFVLLQPLILQAQADLPVVTGFATQSGCSQSPVTMPPQHKVGQTSYRGAWHATLFGFLLIDGLLAGLTLFRASSVLGWMTWGTAFAVLLATLLALVSQSSDFPRALRVVTWSALGYAGIVYMARALPGMFLLNQSVTMQVTNSQAATQLLFATLSSYLQGHGVVARVLAFTSLFGASALGVSGFVLLVQVWRQPPRALPPPVLADVRVGP